MTDETTDNEGIKRLDTRRVQMTTTVLGKALAVCGLSHSEAASVTSTLMLNCLLAVIQDCARVAPEEREAYAQEVADACRDAAGMLLRMADVAGDPVAAEAVLVHGARRSQERAGVAMPDADSDLEHLPAEGSH